MIDKKIDFTPSGVCARSIHIELENNIIKSALVEGGCHGNSQGICRLVVGMEVENVIKRLEGIDCKGKGTSCPDQLARALRQNK